MGATRGKLRLLQPGSVAHGRLQLEQHKHLAPAGRRTVGLSATRVLMGARRLEVTSFRLILP